MGPCGRTFPNGDAAGLARVLAELLRDPEKVRELLARAPEHLPLHTGERIARMYAELFQQARGGSHP
jgi:glycosyltransferase involved in cell wall biosynthesis